LSIEFGEGLGLVAGVLTTSSFVPQIIRVFKLRSAHEISVYFSILLLAGFGLWIVYGVMDGLLPIIFWNSLNIVFISIILYAQFKFGRKKAGNGPTA
jgi:MtN3 and saliva related transmembrane protein